MDAFSEKQLDIAQPARELETTYRQHLQRFRDEYQAKGDLKAVLAIEEELKSLGESRQVSLYPNLAKFQEAFVLQSAKLEEEAKSRLADLMAFYRSNLTRLQIEFTRAGQIEEAKQVLAESERSALIAREWEVARMLPPNGEALLLQAVEVENPLAEPDPDRTTYIIESDGTKGVLKLTYRHPLFASKNYEVSDAILQLQVAEARAADTSETIRVLLGDREVGTQEGADLGALVAIPLTGFESVTEESVILTIQCGSNALMLDKGVENAPKLSIKFTAKR